MKRGEFHIQGMGHTLKGCAHKVGEAKTDPGSKVPRGCKMSGMLFPGALAPASQFGRRWSWRETPAPSFGIHTYLPILYNLICAQACNHQHRPARGSLRAKGGPHPSVNTGMWSFLSLLPEMVALLSILGPGKPEVFDLWASQDDFTGQPGLLSFYTWMACVLMGVYTHVYICECEGQRSMPGVHFIFESGSPTEPGAHRFG